MNNEHLSFIIYTYGTAPYIISIYLNYTNYLNNTYDYLNDWQMSIKFGDPHSAHCTTLLKL